MYDPCRRAETILEQKILNAAGQPTTDALIPFGAHDPITEADIHHALCGTNWGVQRAVVLLAIEYGYAEETTFDGLRRQLLGLSADCSARFEPGSRAEEPAR